MTIKQHHQLWLWLFSLLICLPLLFWYQAGLPDRTHLKNFFSLLTVLFFCQMPGMVFWSRLNRSATKGIKMVKLIKIHKFIGYAGTTVLLLHPVLLVVPRFFESGVSPVDAFVIIITTFNQGIVLGLLSWGLLLSILITALFRKHLPIFYNTWRTIHGTLTSCFILTAAWHVIDLGRHSCLVMSVLIGFLAADSTLFFTFHHFPGKGKIRLSDNKVKPVPSTIKNEMAEPV